MKMLCGTVEGWDGEGINRRLLNDNNKEGDDGESFARNLYVVFYIGIRNTKAPIFRRNPFEEKVNSGYCNYEVRTCFCYLVL